MYEEELHGFKRYEKVQRMDKRDEVDGILETDQLYVFEKLDGANASVWIDDNELYVGSRNNIVGHMNLKTGQMHNEGFRGLPDYVFKNVPIAKLLTNHPTWRLCGEWLVKHTIIYPNEHVNKFYVFDVEDRETGEMLDYEVYEPFLELYDVLYLKPFANLDLRSHACMRPPREVLSDLVGHTDFGGKPQGEGIVIKNYGFVNRYGRQTYGKMLHKDFKTLNNKIFKDNINKMPIEGQIATKHCTFERVCHEADKVIDANNGEPLSMKDMGRMIGTVYHDIITEDMWSILKKWKNPTIDFRKLRADITELTKQHFWALLQGQTND